MQLNYFVNEILRNRINVRKQFLTFFNEYY